jgi:tight adherence protein C
MTAAILTGLGVGVGIIGVATAMRTQRRSLDFVFEALDKDVGPTGGAELGGGTVGSARQWRVDQLLAGCFERSLRRQPSLLSRIEPAMRIAGMKLDVLCSQALLGATAGFLLPFACWILIEASGLHLSLVLPVWVALLFTLSGAALPFLFLTSESKRSRRAARRSVGIFLDLVVLCLAGGMGIEGALHAASQVGDDAVTAHLNRALMLARDAGQTPWDALAGVGSYLGLQELAELAAAVGLAGSHGARIRSTLAAKAESIRKHALADAEAAANSVTERLFLPGVLLLIGFLLFIGYPAVARITTGF